MIGYENRLAIPDLMRLSLRNFNPTLGVAEAGEVDRLAILGFQVAFLRAGAPAMHGSRYHPPLRKKFLIGRQEDGGTRYNAAAFLFSDTWDSTLPASL